MSATRWPTTPDRRKRMREIASSSVSRRRCGVKRVALMAEQKKWGKIRNETKPDTELYNYLCCVVVCWSNVVYTAGKNALLGSL